MVKKTVNNRLDDLERTNSEKPFIPIFQDWDDPNLWHPGKREADPITWNQVEATYRDYAILKVTYTDDWRGSDE